MQAVPAVRKRPFSGQERHRVTGEAREREPGGPEKTARQGGARAGLAGGYSGLRTGAPAAGPMR